MSLRPAIPQTQFRGHTLVTPPASEPVTPAEVMDYLALHDTGDINLIASFIAASRAEIENITGLAMVEQSWRLSLDNWPGTPEPWWDGTRQMAISELRGQPGVLNLPRYPLMAVDSVTVYAENSLSTPVNVATTFDVDTYSTPGRMSLRFGQTWPIAMRPTNAVVIIYTAGYDVVPEPLRMAVIRMAAHMYDHRGCDVGNAYRDSGAAAMAGRYAVVTM